MESENITEKKILIIYHGNCPDGFGAAYAAWKKFGDTAAYLPAFHGSPAPDVSGKEVYMVDFSYPTEILLALERAAARLVVLDHHEGARESVEATKEHIFDNDRSGAGIAWNYFHPDAPLPRLLAHVQDSDLWRHALPFGKEIGAYLTTAPFDFAVWDSIAQALESDQSREAIIEKGRAYSEYYNFICDEIVKQATEVEFEGHRILVVESHPLFRSAVGNRLAEKMGHFGIVLRLEHGKWHCSMRGDGTVDLTVLAQKYGGNGHKNAASFRIPYGQPFPFTFIQK